MGAPEDLPAAVEQSEKPVEQTDATQKAAAAGAEKAAGQLQATLSGAKRKGPEVKKNRFKVLGQMVIAMQRFKGELYGRQSPDRPPIGDV